MKLIGLDFKKWNFGPFLDKLVIIFIDDVLVYSKSHEEYERPLYQVLQIPRKELLYIQGSTWEQITTRLELGLIKDFVLKLSLWGKINCSCIWEIDQVIRIVPIQGDHIKRVIKDHCACEKPRQIDLNFQP